MRPSLFAGLCFLILSHTSFSQDNAPIDSSAIIIVGDINITGNKVTKEHIILRELEFQPGDTLQFYQLEGLIKQSENNLMNISLFNFANIDKHYREEGIVDFTIKLTERWYIWPFPFFEIADPNFNTWWLNKDLSRTSYGLYVIHDNMRGRREELKFRLRLGFNEQLAAQYYFPYINKKQTAGLQFTVGYSRNHEINYKTIDNERVFYKSNDAYAREEFYARVRLTVRKKLYTTTTFFLQYNNAFVGDTVNQLTADYFKDNGTNSQYLSATVAFKHDRRDYIHYPLRGYKFSVEMKKDGMGVVNNEGLNLLNAFVNFHTHFKIDDRLYFGSAIKTKLSILDDPPYYLQRGLGYGNFVRGYEYYVVDGQAYGLVLSTLKLQVVKPRTGHIKWLRNERFSKFYFAAYLNLFADAGYVVDDLYKQENVLSNSIMIGSGIGLDMVTYYDMVLRIEYSVNKFGESGIFLHFTKHI